MAENKKPKYQVDPEIEKVSKQLLNSLVSEYQTARHPFTHIGTIWEVREAPNYDETQERMFVIRYNDGFVYMLEREAGETYSKLSDSDLIGVEVPFKVMNISATAIFVSHLFIQDIYKIAYQNDETMRGTIESSFFEKNNAKNSYFSISCYGDTLRMNLIDFSAYGLPKYLPAFYGEKIAFKVIGIDADGIIHVSKKKVEEVQRDEIIEELRQAENGVLASVAKVTDSCAYLLYKGVPLILRNKDFSLDYTPVSMIKQKGDSVIVKLTAVSEGRRIFVEPVEKYKTPVSASVGKFKRGDTTEGIVTGVTPSGIFVRIGYGIDVLCPVPEVREPLKGDKVRVKILHMYKRHKGGVESVGLRGVIVSIVPKEEN